LGVDELRWAILNASGLESDEMGLPKRRLKAKDVTVAVEEEAKKVEREIASPWDVDEEPIVQRGVHRRVSDDAKEGGKSYWKPEQLT
jgi:hypothetical protein